MEMNAAGARLLQQMDFSPSSDGVNINRSRALWYRYNALRYSRMQYWFAPGNSGWTIPPYHTLRIGESYHNMAFTPGRMFSLSAFLSPSPSTRATTSCLPLCITATVRSYGTGIYFCGTSLGGVFVLWSW